KASAQDRVRYRNLLFRARVKAGRAVPTYQEYGGRARTFLELAHLCQQDKNAGQLEALVAARRAAEPDDFELPAWDVMVLWLKEDYVGMVRLLTERRDDLLTQPMYRWKMEDYLVRGLVKLKRTEEAVREADLLVKKKGGNQGLVVLAYAAHGGAKE